MIHSFNPPPESRRSKILLDCTRSALESLNDSPPRDKNIWKNVRHPDIRRTLHSSLKIGEFWERIPQYEQHGQCCLQRGNRVARTHPRVPTQPCKFDLGEREINLARLLWSVAGHPPGHDPGLRLPITTCSPPEWPSQPRPLTPPPYSDV